MGVSNLLKFVSQKCKRTHISDFSNSIVAIDVNCLIHKAIYTDQPPIVFIKRYVKILRNLDCKIILVFDGLPYPSKQPTTIKRTERRNMYKKRGDELLINGKLSEAMKCFRRCSSISRSGINEIMHVFKGINGIEVIEAPYEADSQLAFLSLNGLADYIITEDSDLIVYGCEKIIFKLKLTGECLYYNKNQLELSITFDDFRKLCILAGCDYLPGGLKGVGIKKGLKLLQTKSIEDLLKDSPDEFKDQFRQAEEAFLYQTIFDTVNKIQRQLTQSIDSEA